MSPQPPFKGNWHGANQGEARKLPTCNPLRAGSRMAASTKWTWIPDNRGALGAVWSAKGVITQVLVGRALRYPATTVPTG